MVDMEVDNRPSSVVVIKQALEQIAAASRPVGTLLCTCHHYRLVLTLAWSPDSTSLVSGTANSAIHVWNAATGGHLFSYRDPFKTFTWTASLAWSPDGEYIAYGSDERTVEVWQVEKDVSLTMKPTFTYRGHANWVNAVAWSPDGRRIASGGRDKTVQVWDAVTGRLLFTYHGHFSWVYTLAWSPDGTRIASAGSDGTVQIWQAG